MLVAKSLLDDFTTEGMWWNPNAEDQKYSGKLVYKQDSHIVLDLIGTFAAIRWGSEEPSPSITIVHGILDDGTRCTLMGVKLLTGHLGGAGHQKATYQARILLAGEHYSNEANLIFPTMRFELTHLEKWIGVYPFEEQISADKASNTLVHTDYTDSEIVLPDSKVKIKFTSDLEKNTKSFLDWHYIHHAVLHVTPHESKSIWWFAEFIEKLSGLLTILINEPVFLTAIRTDGETQPVRIYAADARRIIKDVTVHQGTMLVTYPEIRDWFGPAVQKWIERESGLDTVYELFLLCFYYSDIRPRFNFLAMMQAFESFHRITVGTDHFLPEKEYKKIRNELPHEWWARPTDSIMLSKGARHGKKEVHPRI